MSDKQIILMLLVMIDNVLESSGYELDEVQQDQFVYATERIM